MSKIVNTINITDKQNLMNSLKKQNEMFINSNEKIPSSMFLKRKRRHSEEKEETAPAFNKNFQNEHKDDEHKHKKFSEENKKITDFFKQQKGHIYKSQNFKSFNSPDKSAEDRSFTDFEKLINCPNNQTKDCFEDFLNNLTPSEKLSNTDIKQIIVKKNIFQDEISKIKFNNSNNNCQEFVLANYLNPPSDICKKNKKTSDPDFQSDAKEFSLSSKTLSILSNIKKIESDHKIDRKSFKLNKFPNSSKNYLNIKEIQDKYLNSISMKEKFEGLLKRELILPSIYKCLLIKSDFIDNGIQKLKVRKCNHTFNNIQKLSKEEDFKLPVILDDFQQILYIIPWFYTYKSERTEIFFDFPSEIAKTRVILNF